MLESSRTKKRIRLRWIFLLLYIVIGGGLVGNCFLHMGHSDYCKYAYYALLPAGFLSAAVLSFLPPDLFSDGPIGTVTGILLLPIPFLATCAQYYLLGFLLDKPIERGAKV
jgi:hypothetical protein